MINKSNGFQRAFMGVLVMMLLFTGAAFAQTYSIGTVSMTLVDSARGNRAVAVEVMYPADQPGYNVPVAGPLLKKFPVIVLGHGQMISYDNYQYVWDFLVPRGFMVVLPKTEMSLVPDHEAFARDIAFVVNEFTRMRYDAGSMFYKKYNGKSCAMGHGMGGGAATLAAMYNPAITTLVTLAAQETTPSAIAAAANVEMPALVFSGGEDCIAPPATNQDPMYNDLASLCKAYINIIDATHCNFAQNAGPCTADEIQCSAVVPAYQTTNMITNWVMVSWLRYFLKYNANAQDRFEWKIQQKSQYITYTYSCSAVAPREGMLFADEDNDYDGLVLNMYPNPVLRGGSLSMEIPSEENTRGSLMITDMLGQVVVNSEVELKEGALNPVSVSTESLKPGYYMVILSAGDHRVSKALVIE